MERFIIIHFQFKHTKHINIIEIHVSYVRKQLLT